MLARSAGRSLVCGRIARGFISKAPQREALDLYRSASVLSGVPVTREPLWNSSRAGFTTSASSVKPRDTKAAFQQGNGKSRLITLKVEAYSGAVRETIARWEREAQVSDLNLITEKLGLDRKKYKDISVQMNDIITLRTKLMGNEHPETVYSNAILAAIYRVVGKCKSAANIIQQCVSISETMVLNYQPNEEYSKRSLIQLYASCVEEYARTSLQQKEATTALSAVRQAIGVVEAQIGDNESAHEFAVHLALLQRLAADCHVELNAYTQAKEALANGAAVRARIPDGAHLRYFLLNHWISESHSAFEDHVLSARIHARLSEWKEAEEQLQSAWKVAVDNKGQRSVECCNAFL